MFFDMQGFSLQVFGLQSTTKAFFVLFFLVLFYPWVRHAAIELVVSLMQGWRGKTFGYPACLRFGCARLAT
jgi:hypothetical protein